MSQKKESTAKVKLPKSVSVRLSDLENAINKAKEDLTGKPRDAVIFLVYDECVKLYFESEENEQLYSCAYKISRIDRILCRD
jgi:hypothetical protein